MSLVRLLSFLCPTLLSSSLIWAASDIQGDIRVTESHVDSSASATKALVSAPELSEVSSWPLVLITLLGIVSLILCLAWFAKRFGGFSVSGNSDMRVIATIPMGARERVALIDVKGQQFMLGITTQNINHLHTFDVPVIDLASTQKSEFSRKLQGILKAQKPKSDGRD